MRKTLLFISPNSSFLLDASIAASKLTCSTGADTHFKLTDTSLLNHASVEDVFLQLDGLLRKRYLHLNPKVERFATECQAQIVKRYMRFKGQELRNECGVRYAYGDPMVDMLVDGHGYTMQFEETVDDSTPVSSRSRTDYACWNVYTVAGGSEQVCVTVFETKHQRKTDSACYAQVLGYYYAKRGSSNKAGVAILLNEFDSTVSIDIFLFPYFSERNKCYGVQSLKLPEIKYRNSPFLSLGGIALIFLMCWDGDDLLQLKCPEELILRSDIIKVYTNEDLQEQLRKMKQLLQESKDELESSKENFKEELEEIKEKFKEELEEIKEEKKRLVELLKQKDESSS